MCSSPLSEKSDPVLCSCGHPLNGHEMVPGFDFQDDGVTYVTDESGRRITGFRDVWICTTPLLVDVNDPEVSPWDSVCGCVLHENPSPKPGLRKVA